MVGLGCLGTALLEMLGGEVDFSVDGFEMDLEVELTLELVNVKGFFGGWGGGGGAGALREPMDSNSSFPVILTLRIVFATLEIFWHMLDFRSSMSCFGFG